MLAFRIFLYGELLVSCSIAIFVPALAQTLTTVTPTDPAQALALQLWTDERKASVIYIESRILTPDGPQRQYGTAFMMSDEYALTAKHVVCNKDGSPSSAVELHVGGQGTSPISPTWTDCHLGTAADAALLKVPNLNIGRAHLEPGGWEDLKNDPFVTTFGYGGNQPGRPLKGNARLPVDNLNRIRTDLGAGPADSGAPVLDRFGRTVGILNAGDSVGTTAIVTLRQLTEVLKPYSIFVPEPPSDHLLEPNILPAAAGSSSNANLTGKVLVQLARLPNGNWPTPRTRPATSDEAGVIVNYDNTMTQPYLTYTTAEGVWSVSAPPDLGNTGTGFSAIAAKSIEIDQPVEERSYWSDPIFGSVSAANIGQSRNLTLFARSSYVAYQLAIATSDKKILQESPDWTQCGEVFATTSPQVSNCPQQVMDHLQRQISTTDEAFHRAFEASAADPTDVGITTKIAVTWADFRLSINACRATQVLDGLFDKFTTDYLSGPIIIQYVVMLVQCQQMPEGAASVIPWRRGGETRQVATIRMIKDTLERFAPNPAMLRLQRAALMREVATALEAYQPGGVAVSEAATVIANDSLLRNFFLTFMNRYVASFCGAGASVPKSDVPSILRGLKKLRDLTSTCS